MPVWKFSQGIAGQTGEIGATAGLSVSFEAESPYREIAQAAGLSASFWVEQTDYGIAAGIGIDVSFDALQLVGDLEAGAGLSLEADAEAEFLSSIALSIGLQTSMEAVSLADSIPQGMGILGAFQGNLEASRESEIPFGLSASFDGFNWTEFLRLYGDQAVKRYFLTLTGAEDGLEDVVIPIASFQTRIRNQEPTFLSVSIPGAAQADEISDRSHGQMIIDMAYIVSGFEMHREEIVRADLETIDIHEGGTNSSVVLSGHKTIDWGSPKTVSLSGVSYRRTINGTTRLRTSVPDLYLKPGDFASYDGDTVTVEQISIFVGPSMSMMELAGQ